MFTKWLHKGRLQSAVVLLIISLLLPMILGPMANLALAASAEPPYNGSPITAIQTELAAAVSQRHAAGLRIPEVTFTTQPADVEGMNTLSPLRAQSMEGDIKAFTATTVISFDGPQEAGYDEWPTLEISGNLAGDDNAYFTTGDLTDVYHAGIEEQMDGIWEKVEFGQEPRRYSITETLEYSPGVDEPQLALSSLASTEPTVEDILMGFTFTGPHINHTIEYEAEICLPWWLGGGCLQLFYIKAGFELDWAFGLRLPASATLTGLDLVEQGTGADFETSLSPQDWDATQYSNSGVEEENGNEFVFRYSFWVGVLIKIFGEETCALPGGFPCYIDLSDDRSVSFTTPFGPGTSFPIPALEIELYSIGDPDVLSFSAYLTITPLLTSTLIKADWQGSGDSSGGGIVTYTAPNTPVIFGSLTACNMDQDPDTDQAQVTVNNFRYYFNEFAIVLGGKVTVNVFGIWSGSLEKPFYTLDLSPIFGGLGLYVGDHMQCTLDANFNFSCSRAGPPNTLVWTFMTKDETPPVTSIGLNGTLGTNSWYVSDVSFSLSAQDSCGSGVTMSEYSFDNTNWVPYAGPVLVTAEGETTVYYRSTDNDGNAESSRSQIIRIDKTPPIISGAPTSLPNSNGWWKNDVVVHFEASDAVSGILSVTPDVTISTQGENQSVLGTATDMAGNSAQVTVNDINIDKTPPVVSISNPLAQTYDNTSSFTYDWTALDTLSGINTVTGDLNGSPVSYGQLVELLLMAPGDYTLTVYARDNADNETTDTVDFFVQVDINGLIASVDYMCELEWINSQGICRAILAELNAAKRAIDRGSCGSAENILNAIIQEIEVLSGQFFTEEAANVLVAEALYMIENPSCATSSP